MGKLNIDRGLVRAARVAAEEIARGVITRVSGKTTTSIERAVLRLLGVDGVDSQGVPLPNVVLEQLKQSGKLGQGAAYWLVNAMLAYELDVPELIEAASKNAINLGDAPAQEKGRSKVLMDRLTAHALDHIAQTRQARENYLCSLGEGSLPYLYVIVATGNIYADVIQAQAAVEQGADIIAVIRTTAQSLLDYVPYGPTTEGFGGTYATQANFRIMRQALDDAGAKAGRYIRLTNYCSGLCMPEIAVMGAWERLDMMLNDSMYG
ncbi:MAG: D-lysine 5,6-aminomutase subunit alpha, partial [Peptococcaceae bacterium]|nr:D-lysine 5,6-aminomutase subunit alpha [Peptococcaceae bacterium]